MQLKHMMIPEKEVLKNDMDAMNITTNTLEGVRDVKHEIWRVS